MTSEPGADEAWLEVRVAVPSAWTETVASMLTDAAGTGSVIGPVAEDREPAPEGSDWVRTYVAPGAEASLACERITRRLEDLVAVADDPELTGLRPALRRLDDSEWVDYWKRFWRPFRVRRVAIVTPEQRAALALRDEDVVLELEPGRAFGTGRHATTRSCLLALQDRLQPGDRVLDCGSGSGVLSVAAAKLGASSCFGFDIEPHAITVAEPLARANGVIDRCRFATGGFDRLATIAAEELNVSEVFDVVLANIFWDVLETHAGDIARRVADDGWYAVSGCPTTHVDRVERALLKAGLAIERIDVRGNWATFLGTRDA